MTEEIIWSQASNPTVVTVRYLYDTVKLPSDSVVSEGPINDYLWDPELYRFVLDFDTSQSGIEEEK